MGNTYYSLANQIAHIFTYTAWKMSKYRIFSGLYFSLFSPNTGKYGPEKIPYLDTFHAVVLMISVILGGPMINVNDFKLETMTATGFKRALNHLAKHGWVFVYEQVAVGSNTVAVT